MKTYFVLEFQASGSARATMIPYAFDTLPEAEEKFHQVAAAAAVSNIVYHSVRLVDEKGAEVKEPEIYRHPATT